MSKIIIISLIAAIIGLIVIIGFLAKFAGIVIRAFAFRDFDHGVKKKEK